MDCGHRRFRKGARNRSAREVRLPLDLAAVSLPPSSLPNRLRRQLDAPSARQPRREDEKTNRIAFTRAAANRIIAVDLSSRIGHSNAGAESIRQASRVAFLCLIHVTALTTV